VNVFTILLDILWALTLLFGAMITVKIMCTNWLPKWWVWTPILLQVFCGVIWIFIMITCANSREEWFLASMMGFRSTLLSGLLWLWMKSLEAIIQRKEQEATTKEDEQSL